ncbi:MAG: hypothetical protein HN348_25880, partial [Proteobacteria bacterium]|nr:hypothetical protein [Pseudomonadota bacterium]
VSLRNPGAKAMFVSVQHTPTAMLPTTPLRVLEAKDLEELPIFPKLVGTKTKTFDLDRDDSTTLLLEVEEPALYRFQSTGLLETKAHLRTRTRTSFAEASKNGIGRNFLVERYLGEGTYQVSVSTLGKSRGHLGIQLESTALVDGGVLQDGVTARVTLPAGDAVGYSFEVQESGTYRLRSTGRGFGLQCRFEDDDGWPIMSPVVDCDLKQSFAEGKYRVVVLPSTVETRRLTLLERQVPSVVAQGSGPHRLTTGVGATGIWYEPDDGEERVPHVWEFSLPARAAVRLSLPDEFIGDVFRVDKGEDERVGRRVPGSPFSETLEGGDYRLEVRSARKDNDVQYNVRINTTELLLGQERSVSLPTSLPLVVGTRELVTITSFGDADVKAQLFDATGALIAANNDRPNDWNFRMSERLEPGRYRLEVKGVGSRGHTTTVSLKRRESVEGKLLWARQSQSVDLDRKTHLIPFVPDENQEIIVVQADSGETVSVAVEAKVSGTWRTLGEASGAHARLAVRRMDGVEEWRMRVNSLDDRGNPAEVRWSTPKPQRVSEGGLASGVRFARADPLAVVAAPRIVPGLFETVGTPDLLFCPAPGEACQSLTSEVVAAGGNGLWFVAPKGEVQARRLVLSDESVVVNIPASERILAGLPPGSGPTVVVAKSPTGQPGIRLLSVPDPDAPEETDAMGVGANGAVAVDLRGAVKAAMVWSASGENLEARVSAKRFVRPIPEAAIWGTTSRTIGPGESSAFEIGEGNEGDVRLSLQEGLV